jgi:hypothetical protein
MHGAASCCNDSSWHSTLPQAARLEHQKGQKHIRRSPFRDAPAASGTGTTTYVDFFLDFSCEEPYI